jgi:uncharacterized membrane protein
MISSTSISVILWVAALGSGLMAGIYFAFSVFIMSAFNQLETSNAIHAMNSINTVILRSWFMPLFFATSVLSLMAIFLAYWQWQDPSSRLLLSAGVVYLLGMFVCTMVFSVPLNIFLAQVNAHGVEAQQLWASYSTSWTNWNHMRTVSSLSTCAICIWLLVQQQN